MAHFYGTLRGNRGEATRMGTKNSGIVTHTASWEGAVAVYLTYDAETGQDIATVSLVPWHGRGISQQLFQGPVSGELAKPPEKPEYEIQGDYGQGWETVNTETGSVAARQSLKEYRENEPQYPHRLRRV